MNKHFFKIEKKIQLYDILKILNISSSEFFNSNPNCDKNILEIYIDDFVSFSILSQNKLSFFVDKLKDKISISSGICLIEKHNISEKEFKAKDAEIKGIVTQASDFALESPEPAIEELLTDVYAS